MRANQVVFHKVIHKFSTYGRTYFLYILLLEFHLTKTNFYGIAGVKKFAYSEHDLMRLYPSVVVRPYNGSRTSVRAPRNYGILVN